MFRSIWRRRAARRARHQRRDEYRRRVALGEPPLRAASQLLAMQPSRQPVWDGERTLVCIEGGKGRPRRQGAVLVYGRGEAPREDVIA